MAGDGVVDAPGEHLVPVGPHPLLHVVGHARGDGVARDPLGAAAGEEDERELRPVGADRLREGETVGVGHVVVADHAVERGVVGVEQPERLPDARRRRDRQPAVRPFEELADQLRHPRLVVDTEDGDRRVVRHHDGLKQYP